MIATNGATKPSMNEANERDPFNNNSYGTLLDSGYKMVSLPILDVNDFNERIIRGYEEGWGEKDLPADLTVARSLIPAGTATLRDFSNISPEIPEYIPENCTGCMDCVTECPDTAILGKILSETELEERLKQIPEVDRSMYAKQWSKTKKYYDAGKKKGMPGGMFNIIIDPSKCKGCAECVTVCDDNALKMVAKTDEVMTQARKSHRFFKNLGPSNDQYINDNLLIDMMLKEQTLLYTGGEASTSSFTGQNTKMSVHGKTVAGKQERRKEIAQIAMMHPRTFVAQTTCAHINHFYKSVLGALEFDGPAIISCYTTCQPEHGVADNMAGEQARLAVDSRAFPLLIFDPRKGNTIKERLSLQGNPAVKDDWYVNPKTKEPVSFIDFARSEGRFSKHFDKYGKPSETLLWAKQERLENWHLLQELAGLR